MAGHLIGVIGAKGGVGKSIVATNLAFAFAQALRQKTLLLDCDIKSCADLSLMTGVRPSKNIKDLSLFSGSLAPQTLRNFAGVHKSGVSLISMPQDSSENTQIDASTMGKIGQAAKASHPISIVDLGHELSDVALAMIEEVTLLLVIIAPDFLAIHQTKRLMQELGTLMLPKEMIQFVLNQYQKSHPLSPEILGKQLGRPIFAAIPKDDSSIVASLSQSRPAVLTAKGRDFERGISELIAKIKNRGILSQLERLKRTSIPKVSEGRASGGSGGSKSQWNQLKEKIHARLIEELDLKEDKNRNDPKVQLILREKVKKSIADILTKEDTRQVLHGQKDRQQILKELLDEAIGYGPLEDLLGDNTISEIMVVGPNKIYFEQSGKNKLSDITFTNEAQLRKIIEKIVGEVGRSISYLTPYVDARLPDGSRVHAIIRPCSIDGATLTIRKFPEHRLTYKDLITYDSLTQEMADFLRIAVEARRNIVVSGGTGSGKTTLINMLGGFIPADERIITCEDSAELDLPQEHVVRLETRPPTIEGEHEIDIRQLVRQTLRMKPDRILVGECRGGEALDMLQAMNTGHDGSMTTIHSNNPRDCLGRIETLVQYAGAGLSPQSIREMVSSAVHLIVQQSRLDDGSRKIMNITEVSGMQGDKITLTDIFEYKQEGMEKGGKIKGRFHASGFIPRFIEKLNKRGYPIPRGIFTNSGAEKSMAQTKKVS